MMLKYVIVRQLQLDCEDHKNKQNFTRYFTYDTDALFHSTY